MWALMLRVQQMWHSVHSLFRLNCWFLDLKYTLRNIFCMLIFSEAPLYWTLLYIITMSTYRIIILEYRCSIISIFNYNTGYFSCHILPIYKRFHRLIFKNFMSTKPIKREELFFIYNISQLLCLNLSHQ